MIILRREDLTLRLALGHLIRKKGRVSTIRELSILDLHAVSNYFPTDCQ